MTPHNNEKRFPSVGTVEQITEHPCSMVYPYIIFDVEHLPWFCVLLRKLPSIRHVATARFVKESTDC